jgi:hypothetical protein
MARRVTVTEFVRGFADYINRVAYQGERLVLVRGQRELAEVSPRPADRSLRELPGLLERLPRLGEDDAASFDADVAQAREELGAAGEPEWPS